VKQCKPMIEMVGPCNSCEDIDAMHIAYYFDGLNMVLWFNGRFMSCSCGLLLSTLGSRNAQDLKTIPNFDYPRCCYRMSEGPKVESLEIT
jgi:hypothetical protein